MSTIDRQLIDASKNGDYEKVKKLLENGADINTEDNNYYGWNPLQLERSERSYKYS